MLKGSAVSSSLTSSKLSSAFGRKEIAAIELEKRRLSLARRPSAPAIPLPADLPSSTYRPALGQRSHTDLGDSPTSALSFLSRSQTVDPEAMSRYGKKLGLRLRQHQSACQRHLEPCCLKCMKFTFCRSNPFFSCRYSRSTLRYTSYIQRAREGSLPLPSAGGIHLELGDKASGTEYSQYFNSDA